MSIIITGAAGFLGSTLTNILLQKNYKVIGIDCLLYANNYSIRKLKKNKNFLFIKDYYVNLDKYINNEEEYTLIHLAGIVGDPACKIYKKSKKYNETDFYKLIKKLKNSKVKLKKIIFTSSCSVYGNSRVKKISETFSLLPLSEYAEQKINLENFIKSLDYNYIILRLSTLFGYSYRPRFDIAPNIFIKKFHNNEQIINHGGDQYRPFLNVKDAAKIITLFIKNNINNQIFNCGFESLNMQIKDLKKVLEKILRVEVDLNKNIKDNRSYNVSFKKLHENINLKSFISVEKGIKEMISKKKLIKNYNSKFYDNFSSLI